MSGSRFALLTVGWCAMFFSAYCLFIGLARPDTVGQPSMNWETNAITAERFHNSTDAEVVIVGSSLTERLQQKYLLGIKNLGFSGGSSAQGLAMLNDAKFTPRKILVETNSLLGEAHEDPADFWARAVDVVKQNVPATLTANRPERVLRYYLRSEEAPETVKLATKSNPVLQQIGITRFTGIVSAAPDPEKDSAGYQQWRARLRTSIEDIERFIKPLEARGAEIIFVTLPTDDRLWALRGFSTPFDIAREVFPPTQYRWIVFRDRAYDTLDGIHLSYGEAAEVAARLSQQMAESPSRTDLRR
jgi:hypothetical protein